MALILSMSIELQAKPMGYDYPTPSIPFIEGPVSTTSPSPPPPPPVEYDDYDPDDIPADQAAPTNNKGYEYPVPENPLVLPTKPPKTTTTTENPLPLPDCIPIEERDIGMNVDLLEAGVPLCPDYDEYNPNDIPIDQAPPPPDCIPASEQNEGYNPTFLKQGVPLCPEEELPGYEYPVPENPLTLPPKVPEPVPSTTSSPEPSQSPTLAVFDDYDADDVPVDQAPPAPECIEAAIKDDGYNPTFLEQGVPLCPEELPGYEYPVPENPLTLPAKPETTTSIPLPDCIPVEERDIGMNIDLLEAGVPLCPDYDEYNPNDIPIDQAPPPPECIPVSDQNEGYNPTFLEQGVPLCPEEELPGYEYPVPENPLTLPPRIPASPTTTSSPEPSQSPTLEVLYVDDYDPEDVPIDQAPPAPDCINKAEKDEGYNPTFLEQGVPLCPEEELPGYEYPVPENPLTLPPKVPASPITTSIPEPTTTTIPPPPECIPASEQNDGYNPIYLEQGVPFCQEDELEVLYVDDYDPADVPADQAPSAPDCIDAAEKDEGYNPTFLEQGVPICSDEETGYNYPVPENPLTLPEKPTTTQLSLPECVNEDEKDVNPNPSFLESGVPLCPTEIDEYDPFDVPADQAPSPPDCVLEEEKDDGYNPIFIENGVPLCPEEPKGYEYPVPENPLTLPTKPTTTTTIQTPFDDYDIYDIPADQAKPATPSCIDEEEKDMGPNPEFIAQGVPICPSSDLPGYQPITEAPAVPSYDDYDVYDIPPDQAAPLPECVPDDDKDNGPNPGFIKQGVPICPKEEGYSYPVPENPLQLPQKKRKSKVLPQNLLPEMGISRADKGRVFSFHMPSSGIH